MSFSANQCKKDTIYAVFFGCYCYQKSGEVENLRVLRDLGETLSKICEEIFTKGF